MTRLIWLRRILWLGLGLLIIRLAQLQLVEGAMYRDLAEHNRIRVVPQLAPRGLLLDRTGRRLATNVLSFRLAMVPQETPDPSAVFTHLSRLTNTPAAELSRTFTRQRTLPFVPAPVLANLPKIEALRIEEVRGKLPGVLIEPVVTRAYPLGETASHLIGYLGQPSADAFPILKTYGVRPYDLVGRAGLEWHLDQLLHGRSGGELIEVDHRARQRRLLGFRQPVPGESVTLTIDARLQALIERSFGSQAGACVVLNPSTGEVLAMVSRPGFDPNRFAEQDQSAIQRFLDDSGSPLMNRATSGAYLPGSIAKLVTAIAALEHHVIQPESTFECRGALRIGDREFHCWKRDGHGLISLHQAIQQSCNVYFMQVGRRVGLPRLRAEFAQAGFGHRSGWLMDEQPGHLPSGRLTEGEVALLAIGQGQILVTPLQEAVMVSAIANGGRLVTPWVVAEVGGHAIPPPGSRPLEVSRRSLETLRAAMIAVVNDPQGTGFSAHSDRVRIAGKTGTAQTHLPGHTHGWFVGFCPADAPQLAMAIVAEYGGSGGGLPASIAKGICEFDA
ncbi:MAG: penicillin-binding protein 2 [Candidatus Omnitrophica bacterium]|nr:penicillin-binding protein 2 [Candidatus Omnitrophota bacterium]